MSGTTTAMEIKANGINAVVTWDGHSLRIRKRGLFSTTTIPGRNISSVKLGATGVFIVETNDGKRHRVTFAAPAKFREIRDATMAQG